jgi:hypothetical protein
MENQEAAQGKVNEKAKAQQLAHQNRLKSEAGQVMGPGGRPCVCYGLKRSESGDWVGEHEGQPVLLTEDVHEMDIAPPTEDSMLFAMEELERTGNPVYEWQAFGIKYKVVPA